jgi:uncharacterized membrane protein
MVKRLTAKATTVTTRSNSMTIVSVERNWLMLPFCTKNAHYAHKKVLGVIKK